MSGEAIEGRPSRRVSWLELFFDLVMVACIGQIAHTMHGEPDLGTTATFFLLLAAAWWAWMNASMTMNFFAARITATLWIAVTIAMAGIGIMAAAVPDALGDRAAAFAIGNALIRLVWMLPWFAKRRTLGLPWWRPVVYNLVPVGVWLVSTAVPAPWQVVLWIAAIAIEIALLASIGRRSEWLRERLDLDHIIERVSLLVVIVFGESILSIIAEFNEHWTPAAWLAGGLGFFAVAALAWIYFGYATSAVEHGLRRLQGRGSMEGLRDAVMYLPFLLIAGIVLFAAGLGTAVAEAGHALPLASAVCLAGGMSLFFTASVAESLRYGAPWHEIVLWGPPGIVLPWLTVPIAMVMHAEGVVGAALIVVAVLVALNEVNARRVRARAAELSSAVSRHA